MHAGLTTLWCEKRRHCSEPPEFAQDARGTAGPADSSRGSPPAGIGSLRGWLFCPIPEAKLHPLVRRLRRFLQFFANIVLIARSLGISCGCLKVTTIKE